MIRAPFVGEKYREKNRNSLPTKVSLPLHFLKAAWLRGGNSGNDFGNVHSDFRPIGRWQDQDGQCSVLQILLVTKILISCEEEIKPAFGTRQ